MIKSYSTISTQLEVSAHGGYQESLCNYVSFDVYSTSYRLMDMNIISGKDYSKAIQHLWFDI